MFISLQIIKRQNGQRFFKNHFLRKLCLQHKHFEFSEFFFLFQEYTQFLQRINQEQPCFLDVFSFLSKQITQSQQSFQNLTYPLQYICTHTHSDYKETGTALPLVEMRFSSRRSKTLTLDAGVQRSKGGRLDNTEECKEMPKIFICDPERESPS